MTANFGGVDVVPLLGPIARCHCSEVWWGLGKLAGHCRVPFKCAMVGGRGDHQVWGSGRGAIAGCHCRVPL